MYGRMRLAIIKPPAIKLMVAISDGHCKLLKPIIACPLVQPPAYRVPKPTKKPPITRRMKPLNDNKAGQLKSSDGNNFEVSVTL